MLTQWHLLMEQLQQDGIAQESLAGDTGNIGTQSDTSHTLTSSSVATLKALHSQLGNQGFKQWIQQQQMNGSKPLVDEPDEKLNVSPTESASPVQQEKASKEPELTQLSNKHKTDTQQQGIAKIQARTAPLPQPIAAKKEMTLNKNDIEEPQAKKSQPVTLESQKSGPSDADLAPLLAAFSRSLPMPNQKLWHQLEQYYVSRPTKQQVHMLHTLVEQVKRLLSPQKVLFFEGLETVSHWHLVQALLNLLVPQTTVDAPAEPPQPAPPDED